MAFSLVYSKEIKHEKHVYDMGTYVLKVLRPNS